VLLIVPRRVENGVLVSWPEDMFDGGTLAVAVGVDGIGVGIEVAGEGITGLSSRY
jgi:hypothetical protein